jgi:signal transduction histidine kinase
LGRSLTSPVALVDRSLSEVRLAGLQQRREPFSLTTFVDEITATGILHSEYRGIRFTVAPVDPALTVEADPQLLASAVMNLLHNAFKNTRPGGAVILRAHAEGQRLVVEIEDECGGIPESKAELFQAFGERRGTDRSGPGLGLFIARQAVRAHGGDITIRNMPGRGCIFAVDVPLAAGVVSASPFA